MRKFDTLKLFLTLPFIGFFYGCPGDTKTPASTTTLTQEQANQITDVLVRGGADILITSTGEPTQGYQFDLHETLSCSSGTTMLDGSGETVYGTDPGVKKNIETSSVQDCKVNVGSQSISIDQVSVSWSYEHYLSSENRLVEAIGTATVSGEGVTAGVCGMKLTVIYPGTAAAGGTVTGSLCGINVDFAF